MFIYRITTKEYSSSINGEGAKKYGGRWNPLDYAMLYCASHISLAALEILVHNESRIFLPSFVLLTMQIPDVKVKILEVNSLKKNWMFDMNYTQNIGKDFLKSDLLVMQVPSIVIPREYNVLLNPNHELFKKIKISDLEIFEWDKRLLK